MFPLLGMERSMAGFFLKFGSSEGCKNKVEVQENDLETNMSLMGMQIQHASQCKVIATRRVSGEFSTYSEIPKVEKIPHYQRDYSKILRNS